jgi:UDP-glucose:(heptosyl)LPS alpha-1,3-glucosyltransferase
MSGRGSLMKNMSFFMSVQHVLAEHQFDLAYGLSRVMSADVLRISDPLHAAWLELGYRRGLFSMFRRFSPRHGSLLSIERKSISSARMVLTNSKMVAEQVRRYYGVDPEKIATVYNGFDPDRFSPVDNRRKIEIRAELGLPEDAIVILWAGTNLERKGLGPLIQAMSTVSTTHDFRLLIAGPDSLGYLSAEAEKAGIKDRIILPGYTRDMAPLYQASDLFVLPTRYDPFANTCLEAAACGIPVITTRFNGASEIFSKAAPWLVVDSAEAKPVAHALERFFAMTPPERSGLAVSMADAALPHTWDHHVDRLTELFDSLVDVNGEMTDA